jgi:threonine dehydrogenase-like Zn-dependent dehydrogenase
MAQQSAYLLGAERVIAIDRLPERLRLAKDKVGAETIDYTAVESVVETLKEMTGGRGPDACIDAVGMEAHGTGVDYAYDRMKQALRLHTDRGQALRQAILACRKGGTLSILGVYGLMDKFPIGVIMNKGLTVRTAQQHGQRYVARLLEHMSKGEIDPSYLATHRLSLEEGVRGYDLFKKKADGCVRVVFTP